MAESALSLVHSDDSVLPTGESALLQAKSLIVRGRQADASALLGVALERDMLGDVTHCAMALLALALLRRAEGDPGDALDLLCRADSELVFHEHEWGIVRWDVLLAKSIALADVGRMGESAACARTAIALFGDSVHAVAWHRPVLLGLGQRAQADDDPRTPFLLPKALGALVLIDPIATREWLRRQEAIVRELADRGDPDLAADHAVKTLCALPVDLLGVDSWWHESMRFLGRVASPHVVEDTRCLADAFGLVEHESDEVSQYELIAPLLPRERTTRPW